MPVEVLTSLVAKGSQNMTIWTLLHFSFTPIVKVLILCAFGVFMAKKNILKTEGRKQLSKLVFTLFLPCLIFTELGSAVTLQKMLEWWFIPANVLIGSCIGCVIGYIVALIIKPPPQYFNLTVVMIGVGNIGNIPLVLLGAVCRDSENPFGDSSSCNERSIAYIAFGQWVGAVLAYTYVMYMLAPPEGAQDDLTEPLLPQTQHDIEYPQLEKFSEEEELSTNGKHKYIILRKILTTLKALMQPAINASILAVVVGAIPFLKHLFLSEDGSLFFFTDTLSLIGSAMVPCMMLVLGASLAGGPKSSNLGLKTTIAITFVRLMVMPLVGLGVVTAADHLNLLPPGDKLFRFVLLIQHSMPSSILAGTVASIRGFGEKEISAVLCWEHISALVTMTGWLMLFLKWLF